MRVIQTLRYLRIVETQPYPSHLGTPQRPSLLTMVPRQTSIWSQPRCEHDNTAQDRSIFSNGKPTGISVKRGCYVQVILQPPLYYLIIRAQGLPALGRFPAQRSSMRSRSGLKVHWMESRTYVAKLAKGVDWPLLENREGLKQPRIFY